MRQVKIGPPSLWPYRTPFGLCFCCPASIQEPNFLIHCGVWMNHGLIFHCIFCGIILLHHWLFFHPPHAAVLKAWIEQTGTTTKWATFFVPWSDLSKMEISWKAIFLLFNTCLIFIEETERFSKFFRKTVAILSLDITIVERSKLE